MIAMSQTTFSGYGLTVKQFIYSLSDNDVKCFIDPSIIEVLDALFGGKIQGEDLKKAALAVIDMNSILSDQSSRRSVLTLIPKPKLNEFEERVEHSINSSDEWTEATITKTKNFFGLHEDIFTPSSASSIYNIEPNYSLFDHQRRAVERLLPLLFDNERRAVLHLPTGVGKTRTAMHVVAESLRSNEPSIVVWLASGKELLEQAVQSFKEAWRHLGNRQIEIGCLWGDNNLNLDNFVDGFLTVGLAKGWAMTKSDPEWAARLASRISLVVFDEAHQSVATTYKHITEELTLNYKCALLGLTATPGRTWADIDKDGELADFYFRQKVTLEVDSENPIKYLIDNEFLAHPKFVTLLSEPGYTLSESEISNIADSFDIPNQIIESLSMSKQYVAAVIKSIIELLDNGHQRILVFAASVDHAHTISAILAVKSVSCSVVTANTSKRLREQAISNFKSEFEEPLVLINFGVLTTGFDAPSASAVVIARPTKSLVLFSQMVGRAIRGPKAGGTKECSIATVVDPTLPGFGDIAEAFHNWEDAWTI